MLEFKTQAPFLCLEASGFMRVQTLNLGLGFVSLCFQTYGMVDPTSGV